MKVIHKFTNMLPTKDIQVCRDVFAAFHKAWLPFDEPLANRLDNLCTLWTSMLDAAPTNPKRVMRVVIRFADELKESMNLLVCPTRKLEGQTEDDFNAMLQDLNKQKPMYKTHCLAFLGALKVDWSTDTEVQTHIDECYRIAKEFTEAWMHCNLCKTICKLSSVRALLLSIIDARPDVQYAAIAEEFSLLETSSSLLIIPRVKRYKSSEEEFEAHKLHLRAQIPIYKAHMDALLKAFMP